MSDISTGLIEYAEHKRLLFERIRHKLGDSSFKTINDPNAVHMPSAIVNLTDEQLSSLYVESAEMLDLQISLNGLTLDDDKVKMKWMGLYTTSLAKEVHARMRYGIELNNGMCISNEWMLEEYKSLLAESKVEKDNLITLLNGGYKK